jgi:hypothetical protein
MKLTSLSKAVRAIGAIAALSLLFGTTVQPPVQAQTVAQDDNGVCNVLPEGVFYQEFGGITFSPEQKAAYRKIEAAINARYEVISANAQTIVYTPEQIAEGNQIGLDFEAQTIAILTPEQQPIYQSNLALQRRIQACVGPTPFNRIISPLPY